MLARHANELMNRLDQVYHKGYVEIRWTELYLWYGAERVTVRIWRDIAERWKEVLDQWKDSSPLLVADNGGAALFVWGGGLKVSEEKDDKAQRWLEDVAEKGK